MKDLCSLYFNDTGALKSDYRSVYNKTFNSQIMACFHGFSSGKSTPLTHKKTPKNKNILFIVSIEFYGIKIFAALFCLLL